MIELTGNPIPIGEEGDVVPGWDYCPFCGAYPIIYPQNPGKVFHPGVATDNDCILSGQGLTDKDMWNRRAL